MPEEKMPPTLTSRQLFLDGRFQPSASGEVRPVINPADGEAFGEISWGSAKDVDRAAAAAERAFRSAGWSGMSAGDRGRLLHRIADAIDERGAELARLESLDSGMPLWISQGFVIPEIAKMFRYYGSTAQNLHGRALDAGPDAHVYTSREPYGVIGAITPFNFPLVLTVAKIGPALAAGNTVVHKPAEETALTALFLAEILHGAGLPDGVYNVVPGGSATGTAIVEHPLVRKVAFTGSVETGQKVAALAAAGVKPVTMELGGKCANIIFADADLDAAVETAFQAAFFHAGQFCMSGARVLVEREIHDEVAGRLVKRVQTARTGNPFDSGTELGPLASARQLNRVAEYVAIGRSEGAAVRTGGAVDEMRAGGFYYQPTVMTDVTPQMRVAQEEIFGPVVTVTPFGSEEEAVSIANGTPFGLAAGLHTARLARAHRVAGHLEAGMVWVNTWGAFAAGAPYGGYKGSGYGREYGPEGLEEYLQTKTVHASLV
jgi:acyl-CoA reductase-like NAD-dependent aldehyde dehydrogenase